MVEELIEAEIARIDLRIQENQVILSRIAEESPLTMPAIPRLSKALPVSLTAFAD